MAETDTTIIVIGAGVVGLSTALYLRRSGRDVVVIDPLPPPGGASFGNAGMISADTSVPIALPGMLRKVPSWLADPLGPLAVRPSYFPRALPWLMKWIAAGRIQRVLEISDAMRALHKDAFLCWKEMLGPGNFSDLVRPVGQVQVWEANGESSSAALERTLRERQGIPSQALGADDLRQMFPGISPAVRRGVLVPGNGYTVNPQRIVQTLHRLLLEAGGKLVPESVYKILPREGGGYDVMTNVGFHRAQQIVVAAGAYSLRLLAPLGIRVPLETERGYHVMLPTPNVSLTTTISNKSRSFGVTPMEHGLRVAGTVEIAGLDAPPDERRAKALLANIRTMFPDVNTEGHRFWMGFRPSTPDSLPILGTVESRPGLFLAFGHGHFGMTGGPPSARLVSRLINRQATGIDAAPYAPQRFTLR
ncbi:MAG: FAD-dependent oxidoreductase [Alphaproteobacteria bacterium]|nr:FAD-dependent oxidoreductase [Alphaproteobacteria bacterium]